MISDNELVFKDERAIALNHLLLEKEYANLADSGYCYDFEEQ